MSLSGYLSRDLQVPCLELASQMFFLYMGHLLQKKNSIAIFVYFKATYHKLQILHTGTPRLNLIGFAEVQ